jgi:hypothetical protein
MAKKLTIGVNDDICAVNQDMEAAYRQMAADEAREAEALEWSEGLIGDIQNDPR